MSSKRCPKCKGTDFSVTSNSYQNWNSESDEWDSGENGDTQHGQKPYYCLNCNEEFEIDDLETFTPETQRTIE